MTPSKTSKWICEECGWVGPDTELLEATSPFDDTETLYGCPRCLEANRFQRGCDHEGCEKIAGNGTPVPNGYVWSCFEHRPRF